MYEIIVVYGFLFVLGIGALLALEWLYEWWERKQK